MSRSTLVCQLTPLERCLTRCQWKQGDCGSLTTSHEDHVFILHTTEGQTWVTCIAPKYTKPFGGEPKRHLSESGTLWTPYLFKVPATPSVVSAAVHSAVSALHLEQHR
jgi:hypothetical protein